MASALASDAGAADKLESLDTDLANVYPDEARADAAATPRCRPNRFELVAAARLRGVAIDGEGLDFDASLTRGTTLVEHLTEQLSLAICRSGRSPDRPASDRHRQRGGLSHERRSVGSDQTLGTDVAHVERVLAVLQGFDPPGVFARDLAECLALQLKDRDRYDPAMAALLANLDLIRKRDFAALKAACKVDLDDIKEMVAEIRRLNPKPGFAFGADPVQSVVPDIFVRAAPDGTWIVELNSETLPRVLVNNQYMARVSKHASREEDRVYLSECQANAAWLVKSLDQRAKTILKVAREIVRQQDAFLVLGVQHLRPLNLKTVADAISMHESTVSRVTSNKYMATPRGIFELKYFFTTAIASAEGGDAHSAEAVRHRVKELIEAEIGRKCPVRRSDRRMPAQGGHRDRPAHGR